MKYAIPLVVIAALAIGWATRWDITSLPNGDGLGRAYLLNRWTGTVYFLDRDEQYQVVKPK